MCNACGLVYAKMVRPPSFLVPSFPYLSDTFPHLQIKKRVRESNRAAGKTNGTASGANANSNSNSNPNSNGNGVGGGGAGAGGGGMGGMDDLSGGEGDSDDEDEYGSQDRRSEMGDIRD